jgi:CHAT domain-containing protein
MLKKIIIFLLSLLICIQISPVLSQSLNQPKYSTEVRRLQQQSQANYEQGNFSEAAQDLQALIQILSQQGEEEKATLAKAWTNLGHLQFSWGKLEPAIKSWQEAANIYQKLNKKTPVNYLQIYQAEALQKLGIYPRACENLTQALSINSRFCQEQKITQNDNAQLLNQEISQKIQVDSKLSLDGFRIFGELLAKIGRLEESKILLGKIVSIEPNSTSAFLSLGNTLRAIGNLERDRKAGAKYDYLPWRCNLTSIPQEANDNYLKALKNYQEAASNSSSEIQTKARLNQFSLFVEMNLKAGIKEKIDEAEILSKIIATDLPKLPTSYLKVYAEINYAKNLACLQEQKNALSKGEIISLLENAIEQARKLESITDLETYQPVKTQPKIIASYAVGNLGGFYEYLSSEYPQEAQNYRQKALQLTQEALYLAQPSEAPHIAYQWQWQLGRLFGAEGNRNREEAIKNYELATKTLDAVRGDLLTINSDVQFSFRDNIEPLYRGLVNLLLSSEVTLEQSQLKKAIYYIESLQLAELANFLRCNPQDFSTDSLNQFNLQEEPIVNLTKKFEQVHQADPNAALIYPVFLLDRLIVIFSLPGQLINYKIVYLPENQVNTTVKTLREYLKTPVRNREVKQLSQQLYDWIIKPIETDLENQPQLKTLVFILDSALQNIPMAALYDGKNYLIEKYAVVLEPSLQLLAPHPSSREKISALVAGATDAPSFAKEGLDRLPNVERELEGISREVNSETKLSEQEFIQANIQQKINSIPFSIVHLATHGKFSSNPEQTYILDWNQRLQVQDLQTLLRLKQQQDLQPIELLILSACQTATGDRRAALGLAGVAIRAGARSTLASLWQVNDQSTAELMIQFYRNLQNSKFNKAEALQRAQLTLLEQKNNSDTDYNRVYYWAPFVIVGNWL